MSLAQSYLDRGQAERAEELGKQVLEIIERTQGSQHPDTLSCLIIIAKTYQAQGQSERADELLIPALRIMELVYGFDEQGCKRLISERTNLRTNHFWIGDYFMIRM